MKYMLLIHQGDTPTPPSEEWDRLPDEEKESIKAAYQAISSTPGVSPGLQLQDPESATTVRVEDGQTLITDGPFAETKEAFGGFYLIDVPNPDDALEFAATIPAARNGGAVEVRPLVER